MDDVNVREGVVYGRGGGRELRCDVYTPSGLTEPARGVVLLHGGGWRAGERGAMRGYGERLAKAGLVGVAPEYRLTPESAWPAQIHDVKAAIRWMRANSAALGIDPERIALLGRSAGAHLALLAAGTEGVAEFEGDGGNAGVSSGGAAVVAVFPPTLFYVGEERTRGASPARALMGDAATEESARLAGPLTHVRPGYPPTFLLHGTADKVVPPSASIVLYEALVAAGVPVELHMYAEQPHGFAGQDEFIDLCAAEIAHFLHRYLKVVEAAEAEATAAAG
ncbi:MAG: alpha/beta hydrolase fold domain-containing protein [Dehalococcoidia bacterium]